MAELIAPNPPAVIADDWTTTPWPLPEPMTAEQYQAEQIETARCEEAERTFCEDNE